METRNKNNKENNDSLLELAAEQWVSLVLSQIEVESTLCKFVNKNKNYGKQKE